MLNRQEVADFPRIFSTMQYADTINWLSHGGLGKMPSFSNAGIVMVGKLQKPVDFETAMGELEKIVADMESGRLPLEESLAAYKRGAELLAFCRGRLEDAQQQVKVLENGVLKDFSIDGDTGYAASTRPSSLSNTEG